MNIKKQIWNKLVKFTLTVIKSFNSIYIVPMLYNSLKLTNIEYYGLLVRFFQIKEFQYCHEFLIYYATLLTV